MTLDNDPRRLFEGDALIRRIFKLGLLNNEQRKLDYVLGLTTNQFMERRLQTFVAQKQFAQSVHHARIRIRQRHLCIGKQLVNIPSFMVTKSSESHIALAPTSVFVTGKVRVKRKKGKKGGDDE